MNIHVNEVNVAPVLDAIGNKPVDEQLPPPELHGDGVGRRFLANTLTFSIVPAATGTIPVGCLR